MITTKHLTTIAAFCLIVMANSVCEAHKAKKTHEQSHSQTINSKIDEGVGEFIYQDYKPLANKPIKVRYYNPGRNDAQVLFIMHGNGRNAEGYFKAMLKHAQQHNVLLVVPEFDEQQFSSREYHQGGILDKQSKLRPREDWTFSIIEPLFDYVKKLTGNTSAGYMLYGFSAGSQFVHRFLMFNPENRVTRAIAGSAGTYTMPDYNIDYAYGLKNVNLPQKNLNKFFAKNLMVIVGDADTVLSRTDLVKTPAANQQGRDRVERGQAFFNRSKAIAEQLKTPFNWKFQLIPHVGHSQGEMAGPVAKLLFEDK